MKKTNRTCIVCGERYYYCPSCQDDMRPTWHVLFHEENCKNIFNILENHFLEKISTESAYEQLNKCDLSKIDNFREDIKNQATDIIKKAKEKIKRKRTTKKVVKSDDTDAE